MENKTLEEIKDPVARAKLQGYQEAAFSIDEGLIQTRKSIDEKRGVISAAMVISQRLMLECGPINKAVEDGELDSDVAKTRNKQIVACVNIVNDMVTENQKDLVSMQGQVVGMENAHKRIEKKFKETAAKYERWQRVQEEEAAEKAAKEAKGAQEPSENDETPSKTDGTKKRKQKPGPKPKERKKRKRKE